MTLCTICNNEIEQVIPLIGKGDWRWQHVQEVVDDIYLDEDHGPEPESEES